MVADTYMLSIIFRDDDAQVIVMHDWTAILGPQIFQHDNIQVHIVSIDTAVHGVEGDLLARGFRHAMALCCLGLILDRAAARDMDISATSGAR